MDSKQKEVMLICQEECAEVIQAISKCFRFGFDSVWPENSTENNRIKLQNEVGDLLAMIELMMEKEIINETQTYQACLQKKIKLQTWSSIFNKEKEVH
jgi:NTP pyrophosphatase (non-canonical NTP hydrolase)